MVQGQLILTTPDLLPLIKPLINPALTQARPLTHVGQILNRNVNLLQCSDSLPITLLPPTPPFRIPLRANTGRSMRTSVHLQRYVIGL